MWSHKRSVLLSLILTDLFGIIALLAVFLLPLIVNTYIVGLHRPAELAPVLLTVCYACLPFALVLLFCLHCLLLHLRKGEIFISGNTTLLRALSLCCAAVSLITLASGYFYLPFYIIGIAAAFFALIIRVIKNIFSAAIEIKSENELTI